MDTEETLGCDGVEQLTLISEWTDQLISGLFQGPARHVPHDSCCTAKQTKHPLLWPFPAKSGLLSAVLWGTDMVGGECSIFCSDRICSYLHWISHFLHKWQQLSLKDLHLLSSAHPLKPGELPDCNKTEIQWVGINNIPLPRGLCYGHQAAQWKWAPCPTGSPHGWLLPQPLHGNPVLSLLLLQGQHPNPAGWPVSHGLETHLRLWHCCFHNKQHRETFFWRCLYELNIQIFKKTA